MKRVLVGLTAVLSFAACAHNSRVNQNLTAIPAGQGIAVLSSGASKTSFSNVVSLKLTAPQSMAPLSDTGIILNNGWDKSEFDNEHGHAHMLVLDEGDYCFVPGVMNAYLKMDGKVIAFRVRKGEITYIGSFVWDGGWITIVPRAERDIAAFKSGNPAMANQPVVPAVATFREKCEKL